MKEPGTHLKRLTAEERKRQILQQAFNLIKDQGFKTVSVRDIARASQINEALIYKYFPTKEALLWAVVLEMTARQPIHSAVPAQNKEDFTHQLQEFVTFFLGKTRGDPSIPKIILYAIMENFPVPDEFNYQKEGTFLNWLYRSIEKGKEEWNFNRQVDPLVSLSLFMGGLIYYVLQTEVVKLFPTVDSANIESTYVALFLKSLEA